MAQATAAHHGEHEATTTGLNSRKMLMWAFLGVASLGLLVAGYGVVYNGFIYNFVLAAFGTLITKVAVYAWAFEPVNDPEEGEDGSSY